MSAPTEDRFRALARSAPWRFSTLHFSVSWARDQPDVEAWLSRPGRLRVVHAGESFVVTGLPYTTTVYGPDGEEAWVPRPPQEVPVVREAHGFVVDRPPADYDDPLWGSFDWVAMLDPVELSAGTTVAELAVTSRYGRETWWARMTAVAGYSPRCGCCPLLWGEVSERDEAAAGGHTWAGRHPDVVYPDSWLVGLDVQTGVVVSLSAIGGDRGDLGFEVVIHGVDVPMDDGLFAATA